MVASGKKYFNNRALAGGLQGNEFYDYVQQRHDYRS